jgi:hypothetical protein
VPTPWIRRIALFSLLALALAACSSSSASPSAEAPTSTTPAITAPPTTAPLTTGSTVDPDSELNPIPYNVGEMIGLSGGWRVEVVRVHRAATSPGLPAPAAGNDYVSVDVRVMRVEGPSVELRSAALFELFDQANNSHPVIARSGARNGLDGAFPPGTTRTGTLRFTAPARSQLLMILDGQQLGSQRSMFQIDPPKATPRD